MTFDHFGRLTRSKQITDGVEYGGGTDQNLWMTYAYNLSGALVSERYPSGRVVNNAYESDGDLARIYGKAAPTSTERTYATAFSYTPDGRISRLRLGNGLWEAAKFNSRAQVTELSVGRGVASGDVWKLGYEYGEFNQYGDLDTSRNTGNVARQTLSFGGLLAHPSCRVTNTEHPGSPARRQVNEYKERRPKQGRPPLFGCLATGLPGIPGSSRFYWFGRSPGRRRFFVLLFRWGFCRGRWSG